MFRKLLRETPCSSSGSLHALIAENATALIGYKAGYTIEWIVPSGPTKIRIEEIIYQPEAAGQFHL